MKKRKIAMFIQRFLIVSVVTCVLCSDIMVINAQTMPATDIPESADFEFVEAESEKMPETTVAEGSESDEGTSEVFSEVIDSFDVTEEISEKASEEIVSEEISEEASEEQPEEQVSEETSEEASEEQPEEQVSEETSEEASEEQSEEAVSEEINEEASEEQPEEQVSEETSEEVSEEQSEEQVSEETSEEVSEEQSEEQVSEEANEEATEEQSEEDVNEDISEEILEEESVIENYDTLDAINGTWSNLKWSLADTTLTIYGTGDMVSVTKTNYPWYAYASQIKKVVIGESVTTIGYDAFKDMTALAEVKIGGSVKEIKNEAFSGCTALTAVTIPASVTEIDYNAFSNCTSLASVTFAGGSKLTNLGPYVFYNCKSLQAIALPANLVIIEDYCFYNCITMASITLGSKVTTIGKYAFGYCEALTAVDLPSSIRTIDDFAFIRCKKLRTIDFPYGIKTIGEAAFCYSALRGKLVIPSSVTSIGTEAFRMVYIESVDINASCDIADGMFYNCIYLAEVKIGNNVTGIGSEAFAEWTSSLKKVTFGSKVSYIGDEAFARSGLESITIPDTIKEIGYGAFRECKQLKSVTIGSGVTTVGRYAFDECTSLETVKLGENVSSIDSGAFSDCDALTNLSFINKVEVVGDFAFSYCDGLTEIVLPDSVKQIGSNAFCGCPNLSEVTVGPNVELIGFYPFQNTPITKFTNYGTETVYESSYCFPKDNDLTLCGWTDSTTEKYANDANFAFVPLDDLKTTTVTKLANEASGVHVYWKAVGGATSYNIYRAVSKDSGYTLLKSGVTTANYVDTSVAGGKTYYYRVVAYRGTLKSPWPTSSKSITYIATPSFKKIINVVSGVHVYWNASAGATSYNVYRSTSKDSGFNVIKTGLTTTHYIDTTAKSGTTYYYKIVAKRGTLTSGWPTTSKGITFVGTPDITSRVNSAYGIRLGWDKISGATGYAIYRKPHNGTSWERVTTIKGNTTFTWTDTSVKSNNGSVYKYTIRALAGSNMKTLSGCRNTGRTMARLSSRTLNSAVKKSSTSIKCSWTTSTACNGYEVRFMVGSTVYKTFTVGNYKTGTKTFTGLKAGQTYKIQVRTYKKVSGVGTFYSAWSTAKTVSL